MKSCPSLATQHWMYHIFFILLLTWVSEGQAGTTSDGSLCVSHCNTCPVVCSPASPSPPKSHHSPPPQELADSPPPPPPHPKPSPSPPAVYGFSPALVQQNFSYPYYYFYTSKAAAFSPLSIYLGLFSFVLILFHVLSTFK